MNWDAADFIIFGGMLSVVAGGFWLLFRASKSTPYRAAAGLAILTAFLLVWINGAVGIIGSEGNPENLIFFGVLIIAFIGSTLVRYRAEGMAKVMALTAGLHALIAIVTIAGKFGNEGLGWPADALILNGFFMSLWLLSAWLFRRAARAK